jgi:gliding motility-associated-like protein
VMIDWGESTVLQALGNGTFQWSPATGLGCTDCAATVAQPDSSTTYTVQVMDANGCKATDQVTVFFRGSLFVPNTFTPNGDGVNELFQALVREADTFRLMVFDRWGAPIFSTDDPAQGWDGSHQGTPSPIGVYVWRVDLLELGGTSRTLFGHVTLLR